MSSATEAETGALFYNAKEACTLRNTLEDLGYPHPATPIQTDNACAAGITSGTKNGNVIIGNSNSANRVFDAIAAKDEVGATEAMRVLVDLALEDTRSAMAG